MQSGHDSLFSSLFVVNIYGLSLNNHMNQTFDQSALVTTVLIVPSWLTNVSAKIKRLLKQKPVHRYGPVLCDLMDVDRFPSQHSKPQSKADTTTIFLNMISIFYMSNYYDTPPPFSYQNQ